MEGVRHHHNLTPNERIVKGAFSEIGFVVIKLISFQMPIKRLGIVVIEQLTNDILPVMAQNLLPFYELLNACNIDG